MSCCITRAWEYKILTLQMRCVAFPFAFLRQEIATHERGVRLGFQPLLSLKGDAQAFKNAVCVWNLSGAKFGHTEVWQRMARHFRLPSKWEEQERRKSFHEGGSLTSVWREKRKDRERKQQNGCEPFKCVRREEEKKRRVAMTYLETFSLRRLKAIRVRSIN